ncbi:MAG: hypothetical protein OES57_02370, partial [Acidimicrobiia bacterium]|nr:hypothetical protein [Acidimicrobiia bacterium]
MIADALAQTDGSTNGADSDGASTSGVDDAIDVVVDNWSVDQVDWADVGIAVAVLAAAVALAYLVRRLIRRSTRSLGGHRCGRGGHDRAVGVDRALSVR